MGNDPSKNKFLSIQNPEELKPVETLSDNEIKMPRNALKTPNKELQSIYQERKNTNIVKHDLLDTSIRVTTNKQAVRTIKLDQTSFLYCYFNGFSFQTNSKMSMNVTMLSIIALTLSQMLLEFFP